MTRLLPYMLLLLGGCAWFQNDPTPTSVPQETIFAQDALPDVTRQLLDMQLRRAALVEQIDPQEPDRQLLSDLVRMDNTNALKLQQIVKRYGWPSRKLVGPQAATVAWQVLWLAEFQPQLQAELLPAALPHVGWEISAEEYAQLFDRVRISQGQAQLYGTQYRVLQGADGAFLQLRAPIEDVANLDDRRAQLGLVPHANYLLQLQAQASGLGDDSFVETAPTPDE